MALLRRTFQKEPEQVRRVSRGLPFLGGRSTAADVYVEPERSMQIATVYRCVTLISETIASLPVGLFSRQGARRIERSDDPVARLITEAPNKNMDAGEYWRTVMGWKLIKGNSYVYIERNRGGMPIGLWPVSPASTEVKRQSDGSLAYRLSHDQQGEYVPVDPGTTISAENMLHYRAFGLGAEGLSPIGMARQQVGTAWAATSYVGGFFARDATPGSTITVPGELTDEQWVRLQEQHREMHEGFERAHRMAVLENGAKLDKVSLSPVDADFLQVYKYTKEDIATCIFGVPPDKVGLLDKSTFNNMEQMGLDLVIYCLTPWLSRLERVTKRRLLIDPSDYFRWNVSGLLRGDMAARFAAYAQGVQWGWLSVNDILALEDRDPIENGDDHFRPLNLVPLGTNPMASSGGTRAMFANANESRASRVADPHEQPADAAPGWVDRVRSILVDFYNAQEDDVLDALGAGQRGRRDITDVLDVAHWTDQLAPLLAAGATELATEIASNVAEQFGGYYEPAWAANYLLTQAMRQARNIATTVADQVREAIAERGEGISAQDAALAVFRARRSTARDSATGYVQQIGHFARREGAQQAGASTKTWNVRSINPRPSHRALNGETVDIDARFSNGADFPHDPDAGADETAGCTCTVTFGVGQ